MPATRDKGAIPFALEVSGQHSNLKTVTLVLERTDQPLRAAEIHSAAIKLLGKPLRRSSVKGVLSAYTIGGDRRFNRVQRGVYELRR